MLDRKEVGDAGDFLCLYQKRFVIGFFFSNA